MKNDKINVLHTVTNLGDGGLEKVVYMLTHNIKNKCIRHYVVVLIKSDIIFLNDDFKKDGIYLENFAFMNRFNNISSLVNNIRESLKLAKFIKQKDIRIIHCHDFFPAFTARVSMIISFILYFHKIDRVFVTLHNNFFWLTKFHHLINRFLGWFSSKIICVSNSVMEYSLLHDKLPRAKYKIIFNGIEPDLFVPDKYYNEYYRRLFDLKENEIIIGNIGVLSIRKGQKYLIKAFIKILQNRDDIRLLIFGSERPHEIEIAQEIYQLINKHKLQDKILIMNPTKEINLIYNIFDIFVMPSITEGLSLSAIEAMMMRKLCLFSDIPSFKEVIVDGENGFLFRSKDEDSLYEKLDYLINNYKKLEKIKDNARLCALQKYDAKRMCKEYEELYLGKFNN